MVVDKLKSWLTADDEPGQALIVTGQPGAGKSAVVARAVIELGTQGTFGLAIHARGMTHADVLTALAQLTTQPDVADRQSLVEAFGATRVRHAIVIDALDETHSRGDLDEIVRTVVDLAALPWTRIVLATRPLASEDRFGSGTVLRALGANSVDADNLVDLDSARYFDIAGLEAYAAALLAQEGADHPGPPGRAWLRYQNDDALRGRLAKVIARRADRCFLVAAMAADPLSAAEVVVDPGSPTFDPAGIPSSIGEALTKFLDAQPDDRRNRVDGLLTALAYARGVGIDDRLWVTFAAALGHQGTRADLDQLRASPAADYLLQVAPDRDGEPVTRLYHQALVDDRLSRRRARKAADEWAITQALLPAHAVEWADATPYSRTYAGEHAAACGRLSTLLDDPNFLAAADLVRLVPHWPDDMHREKLATIRMAASRPAGLTPTRQGPLLELAAAHLGLAVEREQFGSVSTAPLACRWAHAPGSPHQRLHAHTGWVNAVAVGRLAGRDVIVSASADHTVRMWDQQGHPIGEPLTGHTKIVRAVALGRLGDHEVIVSTGDDHTVRLWDPLGQPFGKPLTGHTDWVLTVAIGRLGHRDVIVSAGADRKLRLWDQHGHPIGKPLAGHTDWVRALAVGRLGGRDVVVSAGADRTVRLWDQHGQPIGKPLIGHTNSVRALALGRLGDQDVVVSAGTDRTVRLWDQRGQAIGRPLTGHTGSVVAVAIGRSSDRDVIVSTSDDHTVRIWDQHGQPVGEPLTGHVDWVRAVWVGRLGGREVIVSASADHMVRIWDQYDRPIGEPIIGHTDLVLAMTTGRLGDRDVIVSAGADRTVRLWDGNGRPVGTPLTGHTTRVRAVAVGRLGERDVVVSAGDDHRLRLWDQYGQPIGEPLIGQARIVRAVAVGQLGERDVVVSAGDDHRVRLWDQHGHPVGKPLAGHTRSVNALAMGRLGDRDVIVSVGEDRTVRLWDQHGHSMGKPIAGHTGSVNAVAMGRLGERDVIISGSGDETVRIWDQRGDPIGDPLVGHTGPVNAVALGRLGERDVIVSASDDRTVRIWDQDGNPAGQAIECLDVVLAVNLTPAFGVVAASGLALVGWRLHQESVASGAVVL